MTRENIVQKFIDAYIECALWSSTDEDGEPYDSGDRTLSDHARSELTKDAARFAFNNAMLLDEHGDYAQAGHDLWLTRNGHGTGFWDRELGELGDQLTAASEKCGECNLYTGDDGKIHCYGEGT